jgi:hypothetical protein
MNSQSLLARIFNTTTPGWLHVVTSRIAHISSAMFIRLIVAIQDLQEGWGHGYSVGRRTEMRRIILMKTSLRKNV